MAKTVFILTTALIAGLGCAPQPVVQPDPASIPAGTAQDRLDAMRDMFCARLTQMGIELPYRPQMREWTRPSLISFREEARAVAVPRYEELPPGARRLLDSCGGRQLFDQAFRWFFPAHELTHFLQVEFGWQGDHASAERLANHMATAFHLTQPGGRVRLQQLEAVIESAVAAFPDPTPAGQDPDRYFNKNYHSLGRDPKKYGAYQWRFVLDSLRQAERLSFDNLVRDLLQASRVPTAVMLDPALDVGFHVAAHLHLPDVAITLHDPDYIRQVAGTRRQLALPDLLLGPRIEHLSRELNRHWKVHRLVRVPALFPDFADTRTAFDLLLRKTPPSDVNRHVYQRLEDHLLPLYPYLERLSGWEHQLARELAVAIEYEYASFHSAFHRIHEKKWDWARRKFRDEWYRHIAPAVGALNSDNQIRQVVIVLSPALRRHGKSYRVHQGIGRVASQLPLNPPEMDRSLLYAFHELCHGITDPLIYQAGHRPGDLSFRSGDPGKQIHILIEAAANQAMFESLGKTNPEYQARFIQGIGNLAWLAKDDLLIKHIRMAGRDPSSGQAASLRGGLSENAPEFTRKIYQQGWLVPARTLARIRGILSPPGG